MHLELVPPVSRTAADVAAGAAAAVDAVAAAGAAACGAPARGGASARAILGVGGGKGGRCWIARQSPWPEKPGSRIEV